MGGRADEPQTLSAALRRREAAGAAPSRPAPSHWRSGSASFTASSEQRWSLDFLVDQLTTGRRFRNLTVADDFMKKSLATVIPGGAYDALFSEAL
jgi:hypothetical protein